MQLQVMPGAPLRGRIRVAADKSISHRALMLGSIAAGVSRVSNLLPSEDVLATVRAFQQMGVRIQQLSDTDWQIHGVGLHGLKRPPSALDMGNSGTALRLIVGLLCAQRWSSTVDGDASLRARPMHRIVEPLSKMGARIESNAGKPPLTITAAPHLRGIHCRMPIASAQVKSCLLLAGLYADGVTTVIEAAPTRDHTERLLKAFGADLATSAGEVRLTPPLRGAAGLQACDMQVPADLSSAAFFLVGACITPGSDLTLQNVGINPTRNGVLCILKRMGADLRISARASVGGEPVADIRVRHAALRGCRIHGDDIALAIDEMPALAVAAAFARGNTEIRDAGELRVKESDRIRGVASALAALGVAVTEHADGLTIVGRTDGADGAMTAIGGGRVDSCGDHRIAMAFAMAGGGAQGAVQVARCEPIATSFPDFVSVARHAGLNIQVL